jgi:hypothetical protein
VGKVAARGEQCEEGLNQQLSAIDVWQSDVFGNVSDDIQAVDSDLMIYQIDEERSDDIDQLEAL